MKLIPLTKGHFAKVDDDDFDRLSKYAWQVLIGRKGTANPYARRYGKKIDGKRQCIFMHREILPIEGQIDHKDGDSLNNQKSNLRPASRIENGQNRKIQNHSTPYKGVHKVKITGKFQAYICVNKKLKHLGFYECAEEAAKEYDRNAILHFGEFARTNKQMGAL